MSWRWLRGTAGHRAWAGLASLARTNLSAVETLTWLLVAAGLLLRILEYTDNRNLYQDEAALLENLVRLGVTDFTTTLSQFQIAPPGFLVVERLMVRLPLPVVPAGRLVPLLCSLASMVLMRSVARRFITPRQSRSPSVSLLSTIGCCIMPPRSSNTRATWRLHWLRSCSWLAGRRSRMPCCDPGLTCSPSSVFSVSGSRIRSRSCSRGWERISSRRQPFARSGNSALGFMVMSLSWAFSFAVCYLISHRILSKEPFIWDWWDFAFLRLPPRSIAALEGDFWQLVNVFNAPAGLLTPLGVIPSAFFALGLFAVGGASLGRRWKGGLYLLLAPMLFAILASALHQYPFHNRLLIFLVPSIHLLATEGAAALTRRGGALLTFVLGAFLMFQPAFDVVWNRLVAERLHTRYDSHGDLSPDLLDYLEALQKEASQTKRQPPPSPP